MLTKSFADRSYPYSSLSLLDSKNWIEIFYIFTNGLDICNCPYLLHFNKKREQRAKNIERVGENIEILMKEKKKKN